MTKRIEIIPAPEPLEAYAGLCWLLGTSVYKTRERASLRAMNRQVDTWAIRQKDDAFSLSVEGKQEREYNNAQ